MKANLILTAKLAALGIGAALGFVVALVGGIVIGNTLLMTLALSLPLHDVLPSIGIAAVCVLGGLALYFWSLVGFLEVVDPFRRYRP